MLKERKKLTTLKGTVETFREKVGHLKKISWEKDDRLRDLREDLLEKERNITTMQKRVERGDTQNKTLFDVLEQERDALGEDLVKSNKAVQFWATQSSEVHTNILPFSTLLNAVSDPNPNRTR